MFFGQKNDTLQKWTSRDHFWTIGRRYTFTQDKGVNSKGRNSVSSCPFQLKFEYIFFYLLWRSWIWYHIAVTGSQSDVTNYFLRFWRILNDSTDVFS